MDFEVKGGRVAGWKYRLVPVFSNLLSPDPKMEALITRIRAPFEHKLNEKLAVTEDLLYRRGNFNGTYDQLICDALMHVKGAEAAFSPGFRWGTSLLPGDVICTGTPGGVGDSRDPRRYLREGETVSVTVGNIGTLSNPVTFEQ